MADQNYLGHDLHFLVNLFLLKLVRISGFPLFS